MFSKNFNVCVLACLMFFAAESTLAQPSSSVCGTTSTGKQICVRFDNLSTAPIANLNFTFDLSDPNNPKVELLTGRTSGGTLMEWRVWCKQSPTSAVPANIGEIKAISDYDFDVKVLDASGGAGAAAVGTINLDPSNSNKYSRISSAILAGDLTDDLFLQKSSGGSGGDLGYLDISGDVGSGSTLTIPVLNLLNMESNFAGVGNIGEAQQITVGANLSGSLYVGSLAQIAVGGNISGTVNIDTLEALDVGGDLSGSLSIGDLDQMNVDKDLSGTLSVNHVNHLGSAVIGGVVTSSGRLMVAEAAGLAAIVIAEDVAASGSVEVGEFLSNDGVLEVYGNVDGNVSVTGTLYDSHVLVVGGIGAAGTVSIHAQTGNSHVVIVGGGAQLEGRLMFTDDISSDTEVVIEAVLQSSGVIDFGGHDIAGGVDLPAAGSGDLVDGGEVSGSIKMGQNAVDFSGELSVASVSGTIATGFFSSHVGDLDGTITVTGDMSGTIEVADNIGDTGRILINGSCTGTVTAGGVMQNNGLIRALGGLPSSGAIGLNIAGSSGDSCYGTVHIGAISTSTPLPSVPFDGLVCVNAGWRSGTLRYIGCDDDTTAPNVCYSGSSSPTIDFTQTNCSNQIPTTPSCASSCP